MRNFRRSYRTQESRKKISLKKVILLVLPLAVAAVVWLWLVKFESGKPEVRLLKETHYIEPELGFRAEDGKSGLAEVRVDVFQAEKEFSLFQEKYPGKTYSVEKRLSLRPLPSGLEEGEALLRITVASNEEIPLVGLEVEGTFFKGFPVTGSRHAVFYALPHSAPTNTTMRLAAEDAAGNRAHISFSPHIRARQFRWDRIEITDKFLAQVIPYFRENDPSLEGTDLEAFIQMNREQRREDADRIRALCMDTAPEQLWSGAFLRMSGKTTASFGEERTYFYQGREIDRQTHLGVDLASLIQSPVPAANRGRVVFVGPLGIYGNTVVLDHGCGLFSMYAHLSLIGVETGATVERGDELGRTGSTGMAGGDHLHFTMSVHGVFVDPLEWWDPHWIQDNIELKLK